MTTKIYSTNTQEAIKKLKNAMQKLDAQSLDYNYKHSMNDSTASISFIYKGEKYHFEYSKSRARFRELVKGAMSPEKNADDFRKLQEVRTLYRQYFKVEGEGK